MLYNDLDGDGPGRYAVDAAVHDPELAGAEHLVREDLVGLADLRLPRLLLPLPAHRPAPASQAGLRHGGSHGGGARTLE